MWNSYRVLLYSEDSVEMLHLLKHQKGGQAHSQSIKNGKAESQLKAPAQGIMLRLQSNTSENHFQTRTHG